MGCTGLQLKRCRSCGASVGRWFLPCPCLSIRRLLGSDKSLLSTQLLSNCTLVSITNMSKWKALKCLK